jgi:hypothetical protein
MKPFQTLAKVRSPDGSFISLHEHDGEYYIKHNGRQLMSTIATVSELVLADLGCRQIRNLKAPRILIGGLGLGFTLKRVLEIAGPDAVVHVSEILPEVVSWNRDFLDKVNGALLRDPRVTVLPEDVFKVMRESKSQPYDSILLDVDHTPSSWVQVQNFRLYERAGFTAVTQALKPGGLVAYWSAGDEPEFAHRLRRAGFGVQTYEAKAHPTAKRAVHRIYLGAPLPKEAASPENDSAPKPSRPARSSGTPRPGRTAPTRAARPAGAASSARPSGRRHGVQKAAPHPFLTPRQAEGIARKARRKAEAKGKPNRPG